MQNIEINAICDITIITFSLYSSVATMMQQCYYDCNNYTVTWELYFSSTKWGPRVSLDAWNCTIHL